MNNHQSINFKRLLTIIHDRDTMHSWEMALEMEYPGEGFYPSLTECLLYLISLRKIWDFNKSIDELKPV
jgi:hypothetical protein